MAAEAKSRASRKSWIGRWTAPSGRACSRIVRPLPRALGEAAHHFRHEAGLDIGEGEAEIPLLAGAEGAARHGQQAMVLRQLAGNLLGETILEGMLDIGEEGAGAG